MRAIVLEVPRIQGILVIVVYELLELSFGVM